VHTRSPCVHRCCALRLLPSAHARLRALATPTPASGAAQDKASPSSLRYWFTLLDVDGDGCLGREDVRYFYEEQHAR
jgi:hypothetical protein